MKVTEVLKRIDARRAKLIADLDVAKHHREELAYDAEAGNPRVKEQLEGVTKEIAGLESQLEHNEAARRAALRRDTVEAKTARTEGGKAAAARVTKSSVERAELGKKIDAKFAEIAALFKAWQAMGDEIRSDLYVVCDTAAGDEHKLALRWFEPLSSAASGAGAPGALAHAFRKLGIARLPTVSGPAFGFADVAELAADKITSQVERLAEKV